VAIGYSYPETALKTLRIVLACSVLVTCRPAAGQVAVRFTEGLVHGFLVLRTLEGKTLAHGEPTQVAHASRVSAHLIFRFNDGSVHEETVVYSQLRYFRLLREHLVQKGPTFPHPKDLSIDAPSGRVTARYTDDEGKAQVKTETMKLPSDLANGLIFTLLKNIQPQNGEVKASMVITTPKPRLVKLAISSQGEDTFLLGKDKRQATHYVVKIELGGVTGLVAPLVGKQPPDIHAWIMQGEAPAFLKSAGPLYPGGPVWQIELASPTWPDRTGP
jgi:hypothetical protein